MKKLEEHDWWPEMVALKDELSLRELAEKFSVTPGAIMNAFRRNKIRRRPAPPGPRIHRKRVSEQLPPEPGDGEPRKGSKDEQIDKFSHLLGKVPDRVVARKAGVSLRTVAAYRARHGINGFATGKPAPAARGSKIDPYAHLAGTVSDREIAEKAGVTINAVRAWRRSHGVPAATRSVGSNGGSARAAAPRVQNGSQAWRVTLQNGSVGVVIGATLRDAASAADRAGNVATIERLGPVFS